MDEFWIINDLLFRVDGPAYVQYDEEGVLELETWAFNGKEIEDKKLIQYKEWLTDNKLYKPYTQWTDEEKILWRLTWA